MDLKRALGLALCAVAFALVVWGLFFAKIPGGTVAIKVDLPPAAAPKPPPAPAPVEIFIENNGAIRVNGRPSSLAALPRDVAAVSTVPNSQEQPVLIRGGEAVTYETFMAVLHRVQEGGRTKVGLVNSNLD